MVVVVVVLVVVVVVVVVVIVGSQSIASWLQISPGTAKNQPVLAR